MMKGETTVLVIVSSPEMALRIQQALDQVGGYITLPVNNTIEAVEYTQRSMIDACIIDSKHPDFLVPARINEVRSCSPGMHLVLILPEHGLNRSQILSISPDEFLPRSFTSAQLFASLQPASHKTENPTVSSVQGYDPDRELPHKQPSDNVEAGKPSTVARPDDILNLSQRLSNFSNKTDAIEVIVLRRKQLLSHSGRLPPAAIEELVELINSFSKISSQNLKKQISLSQQRAGNGDIVRFIQLVSTQDRYLLYVLSLSREMALALVFDHNTQFSIVRRQTMLLAQNLMATPPGSLLEYRATESEARSMPAILADKNMQPGPQGNVIDNQQIPAEEGIRPVESPVAASYAAPSASLPVDGEQLEPGSVSRYADELPGPALESAASAPDAELNGAGYHEIAELDNASVSGNAGGNPAENQIALNTEPEFVETPLSFGLYITYSCLLIPRMPQHLVNSNLASHLFKWMGQLCLAYGWRLEYLSIQSNYIQWIAGAPLTTSPAFVVRTLRQKTSQYIFSQFPTLTSENPSGDFWAPGFFISGGKQTIQPHLVDGYIKDIREQQGVYNSALYQ